MALLGAMASATCLGQVQGPPITLQLKWFHNFQFAGYYAAQAQGYYRAAGLDVHIKEGAPAVQPVEEVLSGRAQFGVTDASLLLARGKGRPVVALGVVFQHSPEVLLVRNHKLDPTLDGLAGKKVMVSATDADVIAFLRKKGLPLERLTLVPHSFRVQDLIEGRVDAMSAYSIDQPYFLDQVGLPYQMFSPRAAGIDFYGDTLFTDEQELQAHPETVKAFRAASLQGWQYAMAHQDEMVDLILRLYPSQWNRAQLHFEADQMVALLQPELVEMGYMNPERWQRIGATFVNLGMLRPDFTLEGFLYNPRPEMNLRRSLPWVGLFLILGVTGFAYQIHRSNRRFRVIFNSSNDALFIHALGSGEILDVNQRATEMYGYTRDQLLALPVEALSGGVPPYTQVEAMARIRQAAMGVPQVFEWLAKDQAGRDFWVEVNMRRTTIDGHGRLVVSVRDIADRKAAEEEKTRLQALLFHAQKMESLGVLAGGVAHDMNNVLGAILALASAHIGDQPPGSPLHHALGIICKATERGGKMVKGLLSFARQSPAEAHQLDCNAIIRDQVSLLERTTLAKIRIHLDLDDRLRPILGDASALSLAIMNLCVNAVDAMPDNGTLTLRTLNVDTDWIEVVVEDTGSGMPAAVLDKALDPFFTTKAVGKGTGLGLPLVYNTVKAHQGQLEIQSEPGHGTRVMMRFPACVLEAPPMGMAEAMAMRVPSKALKVLIVDDDELIQSSSQMLLEVLGHQGRVAPSGEEALAMVAAGFEPDLVILDMNMPGLGGTGTLPRLRTLRPALPVLLATGRADETALTLASAYPGVTLFPKPFGLNELQKYIDTFAPG